MGDLSTGRATVGFLQPSPPKSLLGNDQVTMLKSPRDVFLVDALVGTTYYTKGIT